MPNTGVQIFFKVALRQSNTMSISEVDKCYLCELLGDFASQHECWNQQKNKDSKKEKIRRSPENSRRNSEIEKAHDEILNETAIELKKSSYCDVCDKNFSSEKYLEIHQKNVHEKMKDEKCDMCDKEYSSSILLRQNELK